MSEPVPPVEVPAEPPKSSSLARCLWCGEFRKPKGERCSHCRQRIGTAPLVGLKQAA